MQVTPWDLSSRRISMSWSTSAADRADVGSSRIRTLALSESALAISVICIWPTPRSSMTSRGETLSLYRFSRLAVSEYSLSQSIDRPRRGTTLETCRPSGTAGRGAPSASPTSPDRPLFGGRARHVHGYALLLGRRIRDVLVDTLVRLESGIDDQLLEVRLGDLEDLEELA